MSIHMSMSTSSEASFLTEVKEYTKSASPKKLIGSVASLASSGDLTPRMTLQALRALQNMHRTDLSTDLLPHWLSAVEANDTADHRSAIAVMKMYCRLQYMEAAECVAASIGIDLSSLEEIGEGNATTLETLQPNDIYQHILPELALGYATGGSNYKAMRALQAMESLELTIELETSKKILKHFFEHGKSETIRQAIRVLLALDGIDDNDSIQLITNHYLRSVEFVTGAVSMETLPEAECPEVCFIGRSNVGKSSLINMICNRKGLAFTSKMPGKTSEFNYFDAKGVAGVAKEESRFYLVDLPGVGFARKQKDLRARWTALLREYVTGRETLRVVYHLVDSRHGLMDADEECLSLLQCLPEHVQYVIVLTKVDKQSNAERFSTSLSGIVDRIYREVAKKTVKVVPILLTSAESRHGGTTILSHILDAVAVEPSIPVEEITSN